MNKNRYLEKLLNGEKVEWKALGEVTNYEQPAPYLVKSTEYSDDFPTPVLTAGKTFILGHTDEQTGIYPASQKIVEILDKLDTYCNSLTEGLPKEIELREKQYQYYRDLLLDFPKN